MEQKPQLIIVPDEDYLYGLAHGAYPEYNKELESGKLKVLSKEVATSEYGISLPEENRIYVRNVFDGTYRDITAESTEMTFIIAKAVAIRETMIMLGAYSVELIHNIKHIQDSDVKVGANGRKGPTTVSVNGHQGAHKELDLESTIKLNPYPRSAKSAEEIRQYAYSHGLGNESTIIAWIERLQRDGKLVGSEEMEVSFLEELSVARDAALSLGLVQCEAGFNIESLQKETHKFYEKIAVCFSEP